MQSVEPRVVSVVHAAKAVNQQRILENQSQVQKVRLNLYQHQNLPHLVQRVKVSPSQHLQLNKVKVKTIDLFLIIERRAEFRMLHRLIHALLHKTELRKVLTTLLISKTQ